MYFVHFTIARGTLQGKTRPCRIHLRGMRPGARKKLPFQGAFAKRMRARLYIVISFLPLILKNAASAMTVEKVRMAEIAEATPSLPRMIWE